PDADRDQQRTVEPPAILVWTFQIDIGGPLLTMENGEVRRAGIEPHVQNVVFLAPFGSAARAFCAGRQKFLGRMRVPRVCAFLLKPLHNIAQRGEITELLSASIAEENDDGNAPETLARDAPVWAALDHFVDALLAPAGNPLDVVNLPQRFLAQRFLRAVSDLIQFDEPLLGGTEDHGIVATPAVRITVLVVRR